MPKNILLICLILLLAFTMSLGLAGCGSEVSAQTISSNAINNSSELTSTKFEASMSMVMEIIGGSDPGKAKMLGNAAGSIDFANMEMQMTLNGSMNFPGSGGDVDMAEAMYLTGGWFYVWMSVPGEVDQWVKEKLPDYAWTSANPLDQQIEFLQTAFQVTKLGTEKIDGVDCYIIQVTPDMEALSKWLLSQQQSTGLDMGNIDLSKMFKSYSVKEWISKDAYLPVKADINVSLEILPQDMGDTPESAGMDKMTINMSEQVKYYDHGKPVIIQLPPEAQNAEEIPSEY
jgi:hypothetical protein